jgi:putative heme-binding domain-containing protein
MDAMSSRPSFAVLLLEEIARGRIAANLLSAAQARTIRGFEKPEITAKLAAVWGEFRDSPKDKLDLIAKLKGDLTKDALAKADLSAGRAVFAKTCASCHKLYGAGETAGPDLTGAGRKDIDYLLGNIVDPSAVVTKDFQMAKYEMKDGRTLGGIKLSETPQTITLQLEKEKVTIAKADIESVKQSTQSLMPDGLLQTLKPEEIRALFAYLQSDAQVELPKEK